MLLQLRIVAAPWAAPLQGTGMQGLRKVGMGSSRGDRFVSQCHPAVAGLCGNDLKERGTFVPVPCSNESRNARSVAQWLLEAVRGVLG